MCIRDRGIKDEWVDDMINCNHFIYINDFLNASECFNGVDIKGVVNFFLYNQAYVGPCTYAVSYTHLYVL